MKNCLIYQPLGLGDILWVQPIVNHFISLGYEVFYPVGDLYYDSVRKHIVKEHLHWLRESDAFPMKEKYGQMQAHVTDEELYLPLGHADRYFSGAPIMSTKYYFVDLPIVDWRKHVEFVRDYEKEELLLNKYDLKGEFVLMNNHYGTNPIQRQINLIQDKKVHVLNYQDSVKNNFSIFDWIGAIENASSIHTVETSLCYFVDKFAKSMDINMYEKRQEQQPPDFYRNVGLVYKNENWKYHR